MSNTRIENTDRSNGWDFAKQVLEFSSPILYSLFWLLLLFGAFSWVPQIASNEQFLPIFTIVFLFSLVSKATSWSIGHDRFGIKGDSRSRIINYHSGENNGEDFWFDLFADNPELIKDPKIQHLIKILTKYKERNLAPTIPQTNNTQISQ